MAFDEEQVILVLMAMEDGQSLRGACKSAGVSRPTFLRWVDGDDELADHYARARERLLDMKAEELEEIGELAAKAKTAVEVSGLRLLSDNRKWLLSKLVPKKYGDKLAVGGADDMPPIQTHELTDAERAVRLAAFLSNAQRAKAGICNKTGSEVPENAG
jgi:hypothetical protein